MYMNFQIYLIFNKDGDQIYYVIFIIYLILFCDERNDAL